LNSVYRKAPDYGRARIEERWTGCTKLRTRSEGAVADTGARDIPGSITAVPLDGLDKQGQGLAADIRT
jgi:hypothetical protein